MDVFTLKPDLNPSHKYAVGVKIQGGGFCPLVSYQTKKELLEGYKGFYRMVLKGKLHRPIAVEKQEKGPWDKAMCTTLPDLMKKVVQELGEVEIKKLDGQNN